MSGEQGRSTFGFEDLSAERFALGVQMRRAAASVTNNIAEGHGRYNWQDNTRFCRNSRGSLCELVDDINACVDEQYADRAVLEDLRARAATVMRLLNGYIAYLQQRQRDTAVSKEKQGAAQSHRRAPASD